MKQMLSVFFPFPFPFSEIPEEWSRECSLLENLQTVQKAWALWLYMNWFSQRLESNVTGLSSSWWIKHFSLCFPCLMHEVEYFNSKPSYATFHRVVSSFDMDKEKLQQTHQLYSFRLWGLRTRIEVPFYSLLQKLQ